MPNKNDLKSLNKIRSTLLKITAERGHTIASKKAGAQEGHIGKTLLPVESPDEIKYIMINDEELPKNNKYFEEGYLSRQVIDIKIIKHITEYRAQILKDQAGNKYIAKFPGDLKRNIQYGNSIKSRAVFAAIYQMLPFLRLKEQFNNDYKISLSSGSLSNFIREGADFLRELNFDLIVKNKLINSSLAHADETGININGSKFWLHVVANSKWSYLEPHIARGTMATEEIGIIPKFKGILCHDNWSAYFTYKKAKHSLCNAHHLRELTWCIEFDGQNWAKEMLELLLNINAAVNASKNNRLTNLECSKYLKIYRKIIVNGEKESPRILPKENTKRQPKQTKSCNLLYRFKELEDSILLFMKKSEVPFSNNLAERDIRMSKVKLKISGCFKNIDRAKDFFLLRSYIQTCKKNGIEPLEAIENLFNKVLPKFILNSD